MNVTQLSPEDVKYHRKVMIAHIQAQAVLNSWLGHIAETYQLSEQDRVDEMGNILRQVEQ